MKGSLSFTIKNPWAKLHLVLKLSTWIFSKATRVQKIKLSNLRLILRTKIIKMINCSLRRFLFTILPLKFAQFDASRPVSRIFTEVRFWNFSRAWQVDTKRKIHFIFACFMIFIINKKCISLSINRNTANLIWKRRKMCLACLSAID